MSIFSRLLGRADGVAAARVEPTVMAMSGQASGVQAPELWMNDVGFGTQSRIKTLPRVSAVISQKHATVTGCCSIVAGDLAKIPLKLYKRDADGREERIRDHASTYLLNVESSPGVSSVVARFAMGYAFLLRGKSFTYSPRDGAGELMFLDVIKQDGCHITKVGRERFYDFEDGAGVCRRAPSRSMVHLRYMADDSWTGRSPIEVAAESMGLALAGQEAAARTASGVTTRAYMKIEDVFENDEDYRRNAKRLRNAINDPDANGIPIIGQNDEIKSLDISSADQELLSSRKFDVGQIRSLYRVPAFKLQDAEHGVKANGEQQAIDYLVDCLLHWGAFIECELALGVLTEGERRSGMFFRHDFGALLRPTISDQYEAINKAVGGPFMTPDEGRKILGMPTTEGGKKLNPAPNMTRKEDNSKKEKSE
ncbi:MAG: phage portal protein [Gammaproteobacteria bacterium]|nr:phage portal protein [Gammaproteobacteria bacterium]